MCQTPDAGVGQDVDRGIEDLRTPLRILRHQTCYRRRQNIVTNAGYPAISSR
jgi:hypothetical protein